MARVNNLTNFLTDVAGAIKEKKGSEVNIPAANFDTEIRNLPSQGTYQEKSVTIYANGTQTIEPDTGYDAISELEVTTQVPDKQLQAKNYNFITNGHATLEPDTGYDGFSSIGLEINVPTSGTDTSDADAVAINIRKDKTAYAKGQKITGTLPVIVYPVDPSDTSTTHNWNYQFTAGTAGYTTTREGTDYLVGTSQIANNNEPDSWMFEGNRKMKLGIPFSVAASVIGLTPDKIKKDAIILGVTGTYGEGGDDTFYVPEGVKFTYSTFNAIPSDWDFSYVTDFASMFRYCYNLANLTGLDTSNATSFNYMCHGDSLLVTVPRLNTTNLSNMGYCFSSCSNLSDESLNNIMGMCIDAVNYADTKRLSNIGLTSEQATRCQSLSNYSAFIAAGWTTGY